VSAAAAGRAKVAMAAEAVRAVNPWSEIFAMQDDVAALAPGVLANVDAVLLGFDNLRARYAAARLCLAARVPYVDMGVRADLWHARISVCDPARRTPAAARAAEAPCLVCGWSDSQLARAGVDTGVPCAQLGVDAGGLPSTLLMAQRAASAAARELLALVGAVDVAPDVGCELRDDLRTLRFESFALRERPDCAADHALAAARRTALRLAPGEVLLADLARTARLEDGEHVVIAAGEWVTAAACRECGELVETCRRAGQPLGSCPRCAAALAPLRRARRVRWSDARAHATGLWADAWFAPGDVFAVDGPSGARAYVFPAAPMSGEPGTRWDEPAARPRFERLPDAFDLARIRCSRLAFLGLGHVGAAALQQLAPLPWAAVLLLDREAIELRNLQAHAFAAGHPDLASRA
jgi:molybdopterin/thiamine biosynthesis adenylyltransferase